MFSHYMAQIMDIKTDIIYTQGLDAQADGRLLKKQVFLRARIKKGTRTIQHAHNVCNLNNIWLSP